MAIIKGRMSKKRYVPKPFESIGISSDTSANIYSSMLLSKAWQILNISTKELYLYCKNEYYRQKKKPFTDDQTCFYFNQAIYLNIYGKTNASQLRAGINELIEKGFIRCIECGANTRTKSIYQYSSKWRLYGTEEFEILDTEKTLSGNRKNKKAIAKVLQDD